MDCEVLISEVHSRIALWSKAHPQHHHRGVLDKLWDEVAKKLNSTKKDVRIKWKYLRDQFRKELNKMPISSDECNSYKTIWPYFDRLLFLKDQLNSKQICENVPQTQFSSSSDLQNTVETHQVIDENETVNDNLTDEELHHTSSTAREMMHSVNSSRKRKHSSYNITEANEKSVQIKKKKHLHQSMATNDEKSDDYHFLMSILPFFKRFTHIQKLRVRTQFQQILMQELTNETPLSPAFSFHSTGTSDSQIPAVQPQTSFSPASTSPALCSDSSGISKLNIHCNDPI